MLILNNNPYLFQYILIVIGRDNKEDKMSDENLEINYSEDGEEQLPDNELQWVHVVLDDFEQAIDALGIETIMFLMSKYHEDIIKAWIKEGVDIQHRSKQ